MMVCTVMSEIDEQLRTALNQRNSQQSLRTLATNNGLIDFCSNDYLGFSRSPQLQKKIREAEASYPHKHIGSTGSRLLSGNNSLFEELEHYIARFHHAEAGLMFNSGYDANIGLLSCIAKRTDTILYDQFVHASIRDGIRLSYARSFSFAHNNIDELEQKITLCTGNIFVVVESIYSMDGECAPLQEITKLCNYYGANLIVDEAHATGVFGKKGEGKVVESELENRVFARVHTFGKALGCHGAIVLGSETLRTYLINFCRSFIYTTALPLHSLLSIQCAYQFLESNTELLAQLQRHISYFKKNAGAMAKQNFIESNSAIQCLIIPGNKNVRSAAQHIQNAGFDVRPILHPTVPAGSERVRICLHAFNTEKEIDGLLRSLSLLVT